MVDHRSSATFRLRMLTVARTEIHWGASQLLWSLVFEEMMVFNDYINTYTYGKCICLLAAVYVSFEYFTSVQSRVYSLFFGSTWHGLSHRWGGVMKSNWFKTLHYIVISTTSYSQQFLGSWSYDLWIMSTHSMPQKNHVIYNVYRFPGHIRPENHRHKKCWPSVVCG